MQHLQPYHLYESLQTQTLYEVCEELLGNLPLWQSLRGGFDRSIQLHIDTEGARTAEAHFDLNQSTPQRAVIQMGRTPLGKRDKGTLAHELVHALQYLSDSQGDLHFITDATREATELSSHPLWELLVYAIYISCPQECEAWQADLLYYRPKILNEMVPWMRSFDPLKTAAELLSVTPQPNQWDLLSFADLPAFWAEIYLNYGEVRRDSEIPRLKRSTLEEFLRYYDGLFKRAASLLN